MIAPLLAVLAAQEPLFVEIPDPEAAHCVLVAVVKLPELEAGERAAARAFASVAFEETGRFSAAQIRAWGSQTGVPPRALLMPDHLRLEISMPKGQLDTGVSILSSILREPVLRDEVVREAMAQLRTQERSVWQRGLWAWDSRLPAPTAEDVRKFHGRCVRPEALAIAVAGAFSPGEAEEAWTKRLQGWSPPKASGAFSQPSAPRPEDAHGQGARIFELAMPPFSATDAAFATRLLAVAALGVGKGASAFRVLREERGWSYRQETFLWPVPLGFQPRLLFATTRPEADVNGRAARDALKAAVAEWTQADLSRAMGLLEATLKHGIGPNPLYLAPEGPLGQGLADRAFLAAYWPLKTGRPFDADKLIAQMRYVRLSDLKETANQMLDGAIFV